MKETTIGNLLVDQALPEQYRQGTYDLDKKGIETLLDKMSREMDPDEYKLVLQRLNVLGQKAAISAGTSVSLSSLKQGPKSKLFIQGIKDQVRALQLDKSLDSETKNKKIVDLLTNNISNIRDTIFNEGLEAESPFAIQAKSGSRGNANQLMQLVTGDGMVADFKNRSIPVPILKGYAEGLSPAEYFAGSYGARQGSSSTKLCLAKGTLVKMVDWSDKAIEDIKIGDTVFTLDDEDRLIPTEVVNTYNNGSRECSRFFFRDGNSQAFVSVDATPDHQIYIQNRHKVTNEVVRGMYRLADIPWRGAAVVPVGTLNSFGEEEVRAGLVGALIGDGCLTTSSTGFCSSDLKEVEALKAIGDRVGLAFTLRATEARTSAEVPCYSYSIPEIDTGYNPGAGIKSRFRTYLNNIGLLGKKAHQKTIPTAAWNWDNKSVGEMIAFLFETDGCFTYTGKNKYGVTYPMASYYCTSSQLVKDLRETLQWRFGIYCGPIHFRQTKGKVSTFTNHKGVRQNYVRNHDLHGFTITRFDSLNRLAELWKNSGVKSERFNAAMSAVNSKRQPNFLRRFSHSEPLGEVHTYDIQVLHESHRFVLSNGLIVSNSTASSGAALKQLVQASHKIVVTEQDCGTNNGLPVDANDPDNDGALLAQPIGDYAKDFPINSKFIKSQTGTIIVRSPLTCQAKHGICAKCAGIRERGRLPDIGDNIGVPASQALGEKLTQGALCLAKGTLVRMSDGSTKPIESIQVGDVVLGANSKGQTFASKVLNTFDNGERECVRTRFQYPNSRKYFLELISTEDHKILGYKYQTSCKGEADNNVCTQYPVGQRPGKLIAQLQLERIDDPGVYDPFAMVLGALIGDGCFTKAVNSVNFSCADPSLIVELNKKANEINLSFNKYKCHDIYYGLSQIKQVQAEHDPVTGRVLPGARNYAKRRLIEMGLYGKYAHEKSLPSEVTTWNKKALIELLGGLFATDGSVYLGENGKPYISYGSTSLKLVEQMRDILITRFGIWPTNISSGSPVTKDSSRNYPLHSFSISKWCAISRFINTIEIPGIKSTKVAAWKDNYTPDKELELVRANRVSIEPVGLISTYDIEVDNPDHLFVLANGLIVSNSTKHSGGMIKGKRIQAEGFKFIEGLMQSNASLAGLATVSEVDGRVKSITPAPQGGHYVQLDTDQYYVPGEQEPIVKVGDEVEAGDMLSNGVPDPSAVTRLKGVGEGRKLFTKIFTEAFKNTGHTANRRNVEAVARGLINHVQITDPSGYGDYLPDDVVTYDELMRNWQPREGTKKYRPNLAKNKYLEAPVLNYTVGTRISPKIAADMEYNKVKEVDAHDDPPPFEPINVRAMENAYRDPNWMTRMVGSYLERGFTEAVNRGRTSETHTESYVPSLAEGINFGKSLKTTGTY